MRIAAAPSRGEGTGSGSIAGVPQEAKAPAVSALPAVPVAEPFGVYTLARPSLIGSLIAMLIRWGIGLDLECATVLLVVDAFTREQCGVPGQMLINASTLHIRNAHLSAKTA